MQFLYQLVGAHCNLCVYLLLQLFADYFKPFSQEDAKVTPQAFERFLSQEQKVQEIQLVDTKI